MEITSLIRSKGRFREGIRELPCTKYGEVLEQTTE